MSSPTPQRRPWAWAPALAVLALAVQLLVLYLPSTPQPDDVALPPWSDLGVHAGVFFAVTLLGQEALPGRAWLVALLCALHAPASEAIQHEFYAHRTGDVRDVLADLVGVALGVVAWRLLRARGLSDDRSASTGP